MSFEEAEKRIQDAAREEYKNLDLSGLNLNNLPRTIRKLTSLKKLSLKNNRLTDLPNIISELPNLQTLSLGYNQLTNLSDIICNLPSLQTLSLRNNQLTDLPDVLSQLPNLKVLSLTNNQLTLLPDVLCQLPNLRTLSLGNNQLEALPDSIGKLSHITSLSLFNNQLSNLPNTIGELANLQLLSLYNNQLSSLPDTIGELVNLQLLSLYNNQLSNLPDTIGKLARLETLYLYNNQLTSVPSTLGQLSRLKTLSLRSNRISTIPATLTQIVDLQELYLHGNDDLQLPKEVLGPTYYEVSNNQAEPARPQDILKYYFRIQGKSKPLNEAKLVLIGFGGVGKTSLVNRLVHQNFNPDESKTEGIQITNWSFSTRTLNKIKFNIWDFGGQEIMHSTHQFFLTERSLYLLVLNGRQGHEDADAEYWLELIQSFGGHSPVIVILNKIEEHRFDVNRSGLKQKFFNIKDFVRTDCATKHGLDELRLIIERETERLDHLRDPFPVSWFAIKQRLANMKENYISFEQYRSICNQNGETNHDSQDSLAIHLHCLGIALNYRKDPRLRDTNILNPLWVTNGIYKILNAHDLADQKGELDLGCLTQLLDAHNYPRERHGFLMELMRKFELCFPFQEYQDRYLIPDLLDKQQPLEAEDFILQDCLNFRYEYPVLPEGLLPRFIVRTHILSSNPLRWRTGVILDFEGNHALVKADQQDRSVTISINGPKQGRRRLLAIIRSDFERIHCSFKSKPDEKVPIPNHPQLSLTYDDLLVMEKQGLTVVPMVIDGKVIQININELLDGVDLDKSQHAAKDFEHSSRALKLFYSYSHKDEALRDQLEIRLKLLKRNGLIQTWHDRQIPPGKEWKEELDRNLEQADIILLLVSPDFLASDYCYKIEMTLARERHDAEEVILIPILLRPVDWNSVPFSHIQALPKDLNPISLWPNSDLAWLDVEKGIKSFIQSIREDQSLQ